MNQRKAKTSSKYDIISSFINILQIGTPIII